MNYQVGLRCFSVLFCSRIKLIRVFPQKGFDFIYPRLKNAVFIKSFSSSDVDVDVEQQRQQSFTVNYLITSCGLPSKDAFLASKKVCIKSPQRSDAVLQVLRNYGFTNAHIRKLVTIRPSVLLAFPEKTLLPKLEFFLSFGVAVDVLAWVVSLNPLILQRSLRNSLIPSYNYLKGLVRSDEAVVSVFRRGPRVFANGWQHMSCNAAFLREQGVPESSIIYLAKCQPNVLLHGRERLARALDRATELGVDRSKVVFACAIQVFAYLSDSMLERKKDVYRRCGWSESDITTAFVKYPLCMAFSDEKIMANMDFLVGEVGIEPAAVARYPLILGLSLEKRLRPRCLVVGVLKSKGLLRKTNSMNTLFTRSEDKFLKKYVIEYQERIPQIWDIYRGKLSLPDLGLSREKIFK